MSGSFSSNFLDELANTKSQPSPLDAIAAGNRASLLTWANRDAQARQAAGQAFQNSLNPDGTPNQARLNQNLVAAGPTAALAAQESSQKGVTLDTDTFALHSKRLAGVSAAMMQLISDNPHGVPQDQINAAIDAQLKAGNLTPEQAQQARTQFGADPLQNTRMLLQNNGRVIAAQTQLENARPNSTLQDTGTAIVPVNKPPLSSTTETPGTATQGGGGVSTGPTAQQLASPFKYNDPTTGEERTEPYGAFLDRFHLRPPPGAQPGTPGLPPSLRNPANKPAPNANGAQPAPAPATQPPAAPTAAAPGMAEKWKASADQYTADTQAAGQFQQRIFPLVQGRALLESGDVTTGRGAEYLQTLKGVLGTAAGQFGWNANAINNAKFEELNKYLTQYTNSLPMAGASDARLASALTGNPSAHISTLANKDVVKALIGLERMKQTAISDYKTQGGQPNQYADYLVKWQNTHDPRAFIFDMLKDEDRAKMIKGMSATERTSFNDTLTLVERNPGIMGQAAMPH